MDLPAGGNTAFIWFSGKGGVGKTTISAATALDLGEAGHDVLIISTDPAHSLSDSLDMAIDDLTPVTDNVDALELDPEEEAEAYRQQLQASSEGDALMAEVVEGLDIMKSGPGVAEMAAFNRFMDYMTRDDYDVIVFDTAPTGHTLKLLQLPEVMESMVGKVLRMRMRFSQAVNTVSALFGKEKDVDSGVEKLEAMKARIERARELMTDPDRTRFNFVLIPETMSIVETERALDRIGTFDIPVGRMFVNQVLPEPEDCDFCAARYAMQQDNLDRIRDAFPGHAIVTIPQFPHEIRGPDRLRDLAAAMEPLD